MQPLRVILADDHPVVLIGVKQVLRDHARVDVVGEATSADELFALLREVSCDVLVTDYAMPGGKRPDGEAMLRRIRRDWPTLPIVLLTMTANVAFLVRAREMGIGALVEKVAGIAELPRAIAAAHAQRSYVSALLKERLAEVDMVPRQRTGISALSASELRVAQMFAEGRSVTEIARKLEKSVATISRQKNDAMRKLGVANHVELVDIVRHAGDGS